MTVASEALRSRAFDDPRVRVLLDAMSIPELLDALGPPETLTVYAEPVRWRVGQGRPALASEDPAVCVAMGKCATFRLRESVGVRLLVTTAYHPEACDWCDYPVRDLAEACDWSTWHSRLVSVELLVWRQAEHSQVTYDRETGQVPRYDNPTWAAFAAVPA